MGSGPSREDSGPISVVVGDAFPNEGPIHRNANMPEMLTDLPFPDEPAVNTPYKGFLRGAQLSPNGNCLGTRPKNPDGTVGGYEWETYDDVKADMLDIGKGLVSLGLAKDARIGVYGKNQSPWIKALLGLWSQGMTCVPLYDTLGKNAVSFVLNHAGVEAVLIEAPKTKNLADAVESAAISTLKTVIVFGNNVPAGEDSGVASLKASGISVLSLADLMGQGRESETSENPGEPDNLAYVMYTSGTTGDPKGVMLTHGNIFASVAGAIGVGVEFDHTDAYLSYLPLAHSFETAVVMACLASGAMIGFYQGNARVIKDDILALRPTLFVGVPRIYQLLYDGARAQIKEKSSLAQSIFEAAYNTTAKLIKQGQRSTFYDYLLFNKLAANLGGRLKMMCSGAAPLPPHIAEFMQVVFKCPMVQGYGMTENAAVAVVMPKNFFRDGTVGAPAPCTEVKLVDVDEPSYNSKTLNEDGSPKLEQGEVWLRGPNVFKGYWKLDEKTKETLTEDGWLKTGDIGQWNKDGSLSIIDRKKNIFKLAQGEYVPSEEIENELMKSDWVGQICVYGNSFTTCILAIVVPDMRPLHKWAKDSGKIPNDMDVFAFQKQKYPELCTDPEIKKMILEDIKKVGKANGLAGFKVPKDIHIECETNDLFQGFSVENDCLTPTFKVKRPQIFKRYKEAIRELYAGLGQTKLGPTFE